jgi:hypothetical protein
VKTQKTFVRQSAAVELPPFSIGMWSLSRFAEFGNSLSAGPAAASYAHWYGLWMG